MGSWGYANTVRIENQQQANNTIRHPVKSIVYNLGKKYCIFEMLGACICTLFISVTDVLLLGSFVIGSMQFSMKMKYIENALFLQEQEMASQSNGLNVLHSFIIDEMRKKETVLEQVLDQTKSIRMGFENFQRSMETKSQEISILRKSVSEMREEVSVLKSQVDEVGSVKTNLQKLKQELIKMKIVAKLGQETRERGPESGLLDWHRRLELQHKQQKLCKACRREAKHRYQAHRSQEW